MIQSKLKELLSSSTEGGSQLTLEIKERDLPKSTPGNLLRCTVYSELVRISTTTRFQITQITTNGIISLWKISESSGIYQIGMRQNISTSMLLTFKETKIQTLSKMKPELKP